MVDCFRSFWAAFTIIIVVRVTLLPYVSITQMLSDEHCISLTLISIIGSGIFIAVNCLSHV